MRWDLSDNCIPNCVPDYFREQFEKEEHEAQLRWERMEHYKANQKKLKEACEAGYPVLDFGGYDACLHCKDADHDTQISFEDDFDTVICRNPDCPEHRKHRDDK